eukprot:scaffold1305_cov144-Skeletonema_menzelii.AAC.5
MKLARKDSIRKGRAKASASVGVPVSYSGAEDDGSFDDCLLGIEHLITPATVVEVMVCRRRCVRAVLEEQARQRMNPVGTDMCRWDKIAISSFAETRRAAVRAHTLGKFHHDAA